MSWIRDGFIVVVISVVLFLTADYYLGSKLIRSSPDSDSQVARVSHHIYHHDLRKNLFKVDQTWGRGLGKISYKLCTDNFGFKSSCNNIINEKVFDIVFIGDSFTEGIGLEYEDTFVGMFSNNYPELRVANMGVSSYSPSIYRSKIEYYLEKEEITFNHVFVFIDISDIQDEAINYERLINKRVVSRDRDTAYKNGNMPIIKMQNQNKLLTVNNFLQKNFPLTREFLSILYYLSSKKDRGLEYGLINNRAEWTYNPQSEYYGDKGVQFGIDTSIHQMGELYKLLKEKNINLSVGIYPWPNQLKYDLVNNLQAKIWSDFCKNKCSYFFNTMPAFFKYLKSNGDVKTYQDLYIYGDMHFNKNGNKVIFEEIKKVYRK
jgi:hypothetical protein